MSRKWIGWTVVALLLVVLAYVGSPYLAVHNFKEAAISADVDKLDATVDFPAVRESLKSQLSTAMMRELNDDPGMKNNPFAGLGIVMMPAIVDKMVDTFVTPDGISALVKGNKPVQGGGKAEPANPDIDYQYEYITMDRFRVKLVNKDRAKGSVGLVFERRGLFTWKLIRLEIPDDIFKKPGVTTPAATPPDAPTGVPTPETAPASSPTGDSSDDQLKAQWANQNDECRGGSHAPDDAVCKGRDDTENRLNQRGWCWAYSDVDVVAADYDWHPCSQARPAPSAGE